MTTRHAGYIVTLDSDRREDDDEAIVTALRMVSGVTSVAPIVSDVSLHIAQQRVRGEIMDQIYDALEKIGRAS